MTTITAMTATKVMVSFFGSSAGASGVGVGDRVAIDGGPDDIAVDGVDRAVVLQAYRNRGGSLGDVDGHVLRDVAGQSGDSRLQVVVEGGLLCLIVVGTVHGELRTGVQLHVHVLERGVVPLASELGA